MTNVGVVLDGFGYVPEDDAWETDGRRTYVHDDDATPEYLRVFWSALARKGWDLDGTQLRRFRHSLTGEVIEIEPGGSECDGHLLHHMRAEVVG